METVIYDKGLSQAFVCVYAYLKVDGNLIDSFCLHFGNAE